MQIYVAPSHILLLDKPDNAVKLLKTKRVPFTSYINYLNILGDKTSHVSHRKEAVCFAQNKIVGSRIGNRSSLNRPCLASCATAGKNSKSISSVGKISGFLV